jgi:hypothetical protein
MIDVSENACLGDLLFNIAAFEQGLLVHEM